MIRHRISSDCMPIHAFRGEFIDSHRQHMEREQGFHDFALQTQRFRDTPQRAGIAPPCRKHMCWDCVELQNKRNVIITLTRATLSQLATLKSFNRKGVTTLENICFKIDSFTCTRDMLLKGDCFGACAEVLLVCVLSTFRFRAISQHPNTYVFNGGWDACILLCVVEPLFL